MSEQKENNTFTYEVAPNHVVVQRPPEINKTEAGVLFPSRGVDTLRIASPYKVIAVGPVVDDRNYLQAYNIKPGMVVMLVNSPDRIELPTPYRVHLAQNERRPLYVVPLHECKVIVHNDPVVNNSEEAEAEMDAKRANIAAQQTRIKV